MGGEPRMIYANHAIERLISFWNKKMVSQPKVSSVDVWTIKMLITSKGAHK